MEDSTADLGYRVLLFLFAIAVLSTLSGCGKNPTPAPVVPETIRTEEVPPPPKPADLTPHKETLQKAKSAAVNVSENGKKLAAMAEKSNAPEVQAAKPTIAELNTSAGVVEQTVEQAQAETEAIDKQQTQAAAVAEAAHQVTVAKIQAQNQQIQKTAAQTSTTIANLEKKAQKLQAELDNRAASRLELIGILFVLAGAAAVFGIFYISWKCVFATPFCWVLAGVCFTWAKYIGAITLAVEIGAGVILALVLCASFVIAYRVIPRGALKKSAAQAAA